MGVAQIGGPGIAHVRDWRVALDEPLALLDRRRPGPFAEWPLGAGAPPDQIAAVAERDDQTAARASDRDQERDRVGGIGADQHPEPLVIGRAAQRRPRAFEQRADVGPHLTRKRSIGAATSCR
jgi:hypothetical protein